MYNRIVVTLALILLLGAAGHAQYYTRSYSAPSSYAYGHSMAAIDSSYVGVSYAGQWQGPIFAPVQRSPSYFNFAYSGSPIQAPSFQPLQYSPSAFNYQFRPTFFQPTYGSGRSFGNFDVNLAPHFQPTYGSGSLGIGGIRFSAGPRQIPFGNSLSFGPYGYSYHSYDPVYATPSRALFNTEFTYRSFAGWY